MLRQPKNKSLIEIPGGLIEEIEISRAGMFSAVSPVLCAVDITVACLTRLQL